MINEINNSVSIVGNISSISEEKTTTNGKKYKTFDVCKNSKYLNNNGEEIQNKEFFTFKIFEDNLNKYNNLLEIGKWLHIIGFVHSYTDDNKVRKTYFVVNSIRDMSKYTEKTNIEIFDYDWLNDPDNEFGEVEYGL